MTKNALVPTHKNIVKYWELPWSGSSWDPKTVQGCYNWL